MSDRRWFDAAHRNGDTPHPAELALPAPATEPAGPSPLVLLGCERPLTVLGLWGAGWLEHEAGQIAQDPTLPPGLPSLPEGD